MSKKHKYIRLENIEEYEGWELVQVIPKFDANHYTMCVICSDDTQQKAEIEKLKSEVDWWKAEHKVACEAVNEAIDARINSIKDFVEIIVADYPEMEYYLENIAKEMVGVAE